MKNLGVVVVAAVTVLAACSKGADGGNASGLKPETILAANGLVKPFDAWPDAQKKLEAKLGKATKVDGDKYIWAAMAGDDCTSMSVQNASGKVGIVENPMKQTKSDSNPYYKKCVSAATGK